MLFIIKLTKDLLYILSSVQIGPNKIWFAYENYTLLHCFLECDAEEIKFLSNFARQGGSWTTNLASFCNHIPKQWPHDDLWPHFY